MNIHLKHVPFSVPGLIICEGHDDVCFVKCLLEASGIQRFAVQSSGESRFERGGYTKFSTKLESIKTNPTYDLIEHIILVADSDSDASGRFAEVCKQIAAAGHSQPSQPLTVAVGIPKISVAMIPPNQPGGCLETFCLEAAESTPFGRKAFPPIRKLQETLVPDPDQIRRGKLFLRTYLAFAALDPCISVGNVFAAPGCNSLIPPTHASFRPLVDFISNLVFSAPPPPKGAPTHAPSSKARTQNKKPRAIRKRHKAP